MLAQHALINARPIVKTFAVGRTTQRQQVLVTDPVCRQQQEVVAGLADASRIALPPVPRGHVHLATDDRLDAVLESGGIELDDSEHVAVISHSDGLHAHLFGAFDQRLEADRPVQKAVVGMYVQVSERTARHRGLAPLQTQCTRTLPRDQRHASPANIVGPCAPVNRTDVPQQR